MSDRNGPLRWSLGCLVLAMIAAVVGFSGMAGRAAGTVRLLFIVLLVAFAVLLVAHLLRREPLP